MSCALFDKKTGSKVDEQLFELREASQTFSFSGTVTGSPSTTSCLYSEASRRP